MKRLSSSVSIANMLRVGALCCAALACGGTGAGATQPVSGDTSSANADKPAASESKGRAAIAWWRFTLAGDESFRSWFSGPDCKLCSDPWTGKNRGI